MLIHLLLTRKGSRYFLPDFGTNLYQYIFEPLDEITLGKIESEIQDAVEKYIPNLKLNDVIISLSVSKYGKELNISAGFKYIEKLNISLLNFKKILLNDFQEKNFSLFLNSLAIPL